MYRWFLFLSVSALWVIVLFPFQARTESSDSDPVVSADDIINLIARPNTQRRTIPLMRENWHPGYAPMLVEVSSFARDANIALPMAQLLNEKLEIKAGDAPDLYQAIWARDYKPHPQYAEFKAKLYQLVDSRFAEYFSNSRKTTIRLDEIRWGGVRRDGIPPLKNPLMLKAGDAKYLSDSDVVFGLKINGDARAYPKRILAWHEMFKDTVGGHSVNGVYCTLCGSLIIYQTHFNGIHHELGTSGFLYRSNKLMYDHGTKSMWNTLTGEPVVGPLVGKGIKLRRGSVVTTTWGEWKRRHPETTVLSLRTGHQRDYGEGAAYRSYFSTDNLMFDVPNGLKDPTLKNKAEVVALLDLTNKAVKPLALSEAWLAKNPIFYQALGNRKLLILTDPSGANRVYNVGDHQFIKWNGDSELEDDQGAVWSVSEGSIRNASNDQILPRYPAHRAFWFGWKAAFPETELIHKG